MRKRMAWVVAFVFAAAAAGVLATRRAREGVEIAWGDLVSRVRGPYTIADRLGQFGERARARLAVSFASCGVAYPPADTAWLAFKDARVLEVHARENAGPWRLLAQYPILGASGRAGPKLREGDQQVPEGAYRVELLNPNSRYHVSMRLDYPNAFDRRMARETAARTSAATS